MRRNASTSLINIIGLVFGLVCTMVIGIYIHHELTYDQYHERADRIFRVTYNEQKGEIPGNRHEATVGPPVAPTLKERFTEVEDAVRFRYTPDCIIRVNDTQHYESRVFYVDPSVFNVFSFSLLKGNAATALAMPNNVVITSEMAIKYFGDDDPIGKTILMNNATSLVVTGVLAPIPSGTHLKFDFLLPFEAFKVPFGYPVNLSTWGWISFHTYVLLKPGTNANAFENKLVDLVKAHWSEDRAKKFRFDLQPLADIYLNGPPSERVEAGNKTYLFVLAIAGCLILVLAGFNFANLYAVISITRAREMGMRKVLGAQKKFVSRYVIGEASAIALVAAIAAIALLPSALDYLKSAGLNLSFSSDLIIKLVSITGIVSIATGVLAALYPATILSSFNHQQLVKGSFRTSRQGVMIRRSLIFIQFCITIALIASVMIINQQMKFIKTKDLGFEKDQLLLLRMQGESLSTRFAQLKTKLLQNPQIAAVSLGGGRMDGDVGTVPIYIEGSLEEGVPMAISSLGFDFLKTVGVRLVEGREISERLPADTLRGVLINESAAKTFGWTATDAIGKKIRVGDILLDGEVIGVMSDFNFGPLNTSIEPLVMYYPRTHLQDIYVRFASGVDPEAALEAVRKDWQQLVPEFPFDYAFLNEYLASLYKSEKFFSLLFQAFAFVAIFISCMGLFALVSQDVTFRVKEIGVRKVLGASVKDITFMISRPFVVLIVVANLIAWPLGWIGMQSWLNEFSYHTSISWTVFAVAGLATLVLAMITIAYKTIRAGHENPVRSLRSE